jgi:hypothetical protein
VLLASAPSAPASAGDVDDLYSVALLQHTHETKDVAGVRVDYPAIAADRFWKAMVSGLAPPADSAPQAERLAVWINAYNILAIDLVARHWPVASIRDVGSLLRPVWKRPAGRIGGRAYSLDEIEHGILRPLGDPRVHMAIVCASTSCPSLTREPFVAARIDAQLDAAAARIVADPWKGVRVEAQGVRLSKIFDWFAADFAASGGVLAFVRRHAAPDLVAALDRLGPDPALSYFDYDWSVNGGDAQPADWAGR